MEWNDIAETKYESIIKALDKAYPGYDRWFADAGCHWPRDYYFRNGGHISVVDDTECEYTKITNGGRACGKSLTAMMEMLAAHMDEKPGQSTVSIEPTVPTVSFQDLYGETK